MWSFKINIFQVENIVEVTSDIHCYSLSFSASSFNNECLGNPITTTIETLVITLKDINGNPIIATENYTFGVLFNEKTCLYPESQVTRQYTVVSGNSSVSGTYSTNTSVDCGQGNCEPEYTQYLSIDSVPTQLPNIVNCAGPVCLAWTTAPPNSPPATEGDRTTINYVDCNNQPNQVQTGYGEGSVYFCGFSITSIEGDGGVESVGTCSI